MQVYSLEEIVAEKLRAILQHQKILEKRGWARSRARDYYDVWRIVKSYRSELVLAGFPSFLRRKCAAKDVSFERPTDFFRRSVLGDVERTWEQWLDRWLLICLRSTL